MTSKQKNIIIIAIALLIALIGAYYNHFQNGFHFDDFHTVVNNIHIRYLKNIPQFFSDPKMFSSDPDHWGLRPLVTTTLAIDYWLGNSLDPFYFHLSTFIWFILLCIIMYFVYQKILKLSFKHSWIEYMCLFAVAWYAFNTANAETINYVISRSDVLSTFFIVASFAIYISYPNKRKWYLYIIPAIIGVFAKETVLVLIILLFFYILLFEKELSISELFKVKNFKIVLNTIVVLLPILLVVIAVQIYALSKITSVPGITNPAGYYWLTQTYVWLHYFVSFFFPVQLSADTDLAVILTVFDIKILTGLVFVVLLMIAIFKTSNKKETRPIAFGLIWFAAALLPTSVAPFAEVMNDHRMFFPFIGLSLSVVTFIAQLMMKYEQKLLSNQNYKIYIGSAMLMILALNAYGVHERNKVWRTEETLWYDVTIKSPKNGRGLMNYGLAIMARGNYNLALTYFEKAQQLIPTYSFLYINMGIARAEIGMVKEAELNFEKALFFAPANHDSYTFYAEFLLNQDKTNRAIQLAQKALTLNPHSIKALNVLMSCYNKLRMWPELEQTANQLLTFLPGDVTALRFLNAAKTKKPITTGGTNFHEVVKGMSATELLNLSLVYYNIGSYTQCIQICQRAIALKPDYADAYSNMAAAYNKQKNWLSAIEASKKALQIDPNHKYAQGNLTWALNEKEQ